MRFSRFNSYKETGVDWMGEIPLDWEIKRVRHLFEIRKRISGAEGYDVLSITQQGIKVKDTESGDGQLSADYSKYQFVEVGDFAMNHMDLLTGYVDVSPVFGVTSPDYRVFSVRNKKACFDRYYLYLFQAGYRNKIFFAYGQGSSQLGRWRFPTDEFNNFLFPCPPIEDQQQIAKFLDRETAKIDALVAEQQRLIELLKEKRQAVISHAVTKGLDPYAAMKDSGVEWLGEMPGHWTRPALNSRFSVELGKMLDQSRVTGNHLVPYLRNTDVQWDSINGEELPEMDITESEYSRYTVEIGDLLVCEGGEVGRAAMVKNKPGVLGYQKALHRLRPRDKSEAPRFMYYALSWAVATGVFNLGGSATIAHLTAEQLRRYRFPKPPTEEQLAIVTFLDGSVSTIDSLTAEAERAIALLQERRTALISAAVTGKIDVRGLATEKGAAA